MTVLCLWTPYKAYDRGKEGGREPVGKEPRRNRHSAKLKVEDIYGLMCRLDRHAGNLDNLFVLEEPVRSQLMFPHVLPQCFES